MKMNLRVKIERFDAVAALWASLDIVKGLQEEHPHIPELKRLAELLYEAGDAFKLEEVKEWNSESTG